MEPGSVTTLGEIRGCMSVALQNPLCRQQPVNSYRTTRMDACRGDTDLKKKEKYTSCIYIYFFYLIPRFITNMYTYKNNTCRYAHICIYISDQL